MTLDLEAIKARAAAATPGPWTGHEEAGRVIVSASNSDLSLLALDVDGTAIVFSHADHAFICHARTDIPALVAEVERLIPHRQAVAAVFRYIAELAARDIGLPLAPGLDEALNAISRAVAS